MSDDVKDISFWGEECSFSCSKNATAEDVKHNQVELNIYDNIVRLAPAVKELYSEMFGEA